jgi:NAD(P)-dependent dehydrogenase (short-subunit alcohol dehydrogenase family)
LEDLPLRDKVVLVTGSARRIGRALAQASAKAGADVVIHFRNSRDEASETQRELQALGRHAWTLQADLEDTEQAAQLVERASAFGPLYALVNSAAVFDRRTMQATSRGDWARTLALNLTAPFILTQAFATRIVAGSQGRVVNILDWRALRPDGEHFAYSISKAALAALTRSLALSLAPAVSVNGLALGAILPPEGGQSSPHANVLEHVPAGRWGALAEVEEAFLFLLTGPDYVTGEIIHVDGGRHLV